MKIIKLTKNKQAIVDNEDYEYLNQWKWHYYRYPVRTDNMLKTKIKMYNIIMNCPKNKVVDHINGNTLDNRKENLRICSHKENSRNRYINRGAKISKYKGVSKMHNKYWRAYIKIEGKQKYLGLFETELDAAKAYNKAALNYYGTFAKLNNV